MGLFAADLFWSQMWNPGGVAWQIVTVVVAPKAREEPDGPWPASPATLLRRIGNFR